MDFLGRIFDLIFMRQRKSSQRPDDPATLDMERAYAPVPPLLIFDPALRPIRHAMRTAEPQFQDPDHAARWHRLRSQLLQHILRQIGETAAASHLVLRGSVTMVGWFGAQARCPGDLDFLVLASDRKPSARHAESLIDQIIACAGGPSPVPGVVFPPNQFAVENIWEYERVPGRRVVLPWKSEDPLLNGTIQLDFAFDEQMFSLPIKTPISLDGSPAVQMQTASPEQSLAWKFRWLMTDQYLLGKDLFDAVLLAEHCHPSATFLLHHLEPELRTRGSAIRIRIGELLDQNLGGGAVRWDEFLKEYPQVTGTGREWTSRLASSMSDCLKTLHAQLRHDCGG